VLAIKAGAAGRPAGSTAERLRAAAAAGLASQSQIEGLVGAHGTILGAILGQQIADAGVGVRLGTRVATGDLGKRGRAALREALRRVPGALDLVGEGTLRY